MGGVKNREAKKKANHVVSSGSGGGTKGPSVIDKRGQEIKCMYCDKVYKESGKLKHHIATKHADQLPLGTVEKEELQPSTPAAAPVRPGKQSPDPASSSVAAATTSKPQTQQSHHHHHHHHQQQQQQQRQQLTQQQQGEPQQAAGAGDAGGMMDVGSKAGYYTSKSPKLHLLEWAQRSGFERPKYKVNKQEEDGTVTCRVFINHPKRKEEEVVAFLDRKYAAEDPQEAEQRTALTALEKVAGSCNYHMLLPKQYLQLWKELGQATVERKEREAARAAEVERQQQREKAREVKEAHFAPQKVVMSKEIQAALQVLVQERYALRAQMAAVGGAMGPGSSASLSSSDGSHICSTAGASSLGGSCVSGSTTGGGAGGHGPAAALPPLPTAVPNHSALCAELAKMGFTSTQVQMAMEYAARVAHQWAATKEGLLEWLLVHVPTDQLPPKFNKGSATNAVTVLSAASKQQLQQQQQQASKGLGGSGGGGSGDESACVLTEVQQQSVNRLGLWGYTPEACEAALQAANFDEACALPLLLSAVSGCEVLQADTDAASNESWAEEVMVLEAIYGEQVQTMGAGAVHVRLPLPPDCPLALYAVDDAPQECQLEVICSKGSGGAVYPACLPLIALSCPCAPPPALRRATRALACMARRLIGQPMLHDLVGLLSDLLTQLHPEDELSEDEESRQSRMELQSTPAGGLQAAPEEAAHTELEDLQEHLCEMEGCGMGRETADMMGVRRAPGQGRGGGAGKARGAGRSLGGPPSAEAQAESKRLLAHQQMLQTSPSHERMRVVRASLPAASKEADVLDALQRSLVLVISGATGCGKSTQVPQYILDEAIRQGAGSATNIVVTQPRRISALGLAQRVAQERGEGVGEVVGYSVKMDNKSSRRTRLLFCTTGILMRRLSSEPSLDSISHIILDEVHERSVEIDLLLLLLRDVVVRRAAAAAAPHHHLGSDPAPPLRLVLMSATANAQLFADYMHAYLGNALQDLKGGAAWAAPGQPSMIAQLSIPGLTQPVRDLFLEDILERTGHQIGRTSKYAKPSNKSNPGKSHEAYLDPNTSYSQTTLTSLALVDEEQINYDLLAVLVTHIVEQQRVQGPAACMDGWQEGLQALKKVKANQGAAGGAVLVFLPGAPEIGKAARALSGHQPLQSAAGGPQQLRVVSLYGSLSSQDQAKVFNRPPPGVFKIVLATNVAETSITIDDVSFVVDTGRAKEMQHDTDRGILRLQEQWVSQASAQQRRGRAGRVRPGLCFRMFSRRQWARMDPHTAPEMLRSPLESVCLTIQAMITTHRQAHQEQLQQDMAEQLEASQVFSKRKQPRRPQQLPQSGRGGRSSSGSSIMLQDVRAVLRHCLSPPPSAAVEGALGLLRQIGALDGAEELTALGHHLKQMPMDPRVGKMLVYGAMLACLDPVLTIAAAMAHGRPVFMSPRPDERNEVELARVSLLQGAKSARSDHIALVAAFNGWARALAKGGRSEGGAFASRYSLSESSLEAVAQGRGEYAATLEELGFLPYGCASSFRVQRGSNGGQSGGGYAAWMGLPVNSCATNARFLKAAVMAGFYPSVLRVQNPPPTYVKVEGGTVEAEASPAAVKFFDRTRGRTFMHPTSVNFSVGKFESSWLVYTQMTATSKLFVRESSMAPVYSMLLFGGELSVQLDKGQILVDGWATFSVPPHVGVYIKELRQILDDVQAQKIQDPSYELSSNKAVALVMRLIEIDGF